MEIPDATAYAALGAMALSLFGYILYNERARLTRSEHRDIHRDETKAVGESLKRLERSINEEKRMLHDEFEKSVVRLEGQFGEIKEMLERETMDSQEYRRRLSDAVHAIRIRIAIVQTKLGITDDASAGPNDSGNFKGLG
jgi:hypothetical protein